MIESALTLSKRIYGRLIDQKQIILNGKLGLYDGSMGASMFVYHFGSIDDEGELALDQADEILLSIVQRLHEVNNDSFCYGLFGIGWGIDYLIDQEFVNASPKILGQIDNVLMRYNAYSADPGIMNGTLGYAIYMASRFNKMFLQGGEFIQQLRCCEKCGTMIQFIDQIEVNMHQLFLKWPINKTADIDNLIFTNPPFLSEVTTALTESYFFFSHLMRFNLYPQIITNLLIDIKSKIFICLDWCLQALNGDKKLAYRFQWLNNTLMLLWVSSDFSTSDEFLGWIARFTKHVLPVLRFNTGQQHFVDNLTVHLLVRLYHHSGNPEFCQAAVQLTENIFDSITSNNKNNYSLKSGLSGLGLAMLGIISESTMNWDRCLGLS